MLALDRLHVKHQHDLPAGCLCMLLLLKAGTSNAKLNKQMSITRCLQERELVYDYSWYSCMAAADPASCCFATTCRVGFFSTASSARVHCCPNSSPCSAHASHTFCCASPALPGGGLRQQASA